jgi:hypothetical protein
MQDAGYCRVPLLRRDNSVRAWALVDAEDFQELSRFRWRVNSISGEPGKEGYAVRMARLPDGRMRYQGMHRQILGLEHGDKLEVDHINRKTLDNRRRNLRVVTHAENMRNRPVHRGSVSRYRAVHWEESKRRWRAQVKVEGKKVHLGYFQNEDAAGLASHEYLKSLGWPVDALPMP